MSRWFYINFIIILLVIWKISSSYWALHIIFGGVGFAFFMFNWMRHAMFSTLRSNMERKRKIKFARFSKKAMPFHRWMGTTAFIFIMAHAGIVFYRFGFQPNHFKMMIGFMAGIILFLVVITGWIRHYRTTVRRRIIHMSLGFTLFYLIIIHIIFV